MEGLRLEELMTMEERNWERLRNLRIIWWITSFSSMFEIIKTMGSICKTYIYIYIEYFVTLHSLVCATCAHPHLRPTPPPARLPHRQHARPVDCMLAPPLDIVGKQSDSDRDLVGLRPWLDRGRILAGLLSEYDQFATTSSRGVGGHNSAGFRS